MSTLKISSYDQQAIDFLESTKTEIEFKKIGHDFYFDEDKEERDIWRITIVRRLSNIKKWSFRFGQSIANVGKKPSAYDVLSSLTKYDPGTFDNFCGDFGYDSDSRKAEKIYLAVQKEWESVNYLFSDNELESLRGIE